MGESDLMFTGIVTDVGTVGSLKPLDQGVRVRIETAYDPATIAIGASISCAGETWFKYPRTAGSHSASRCWR